MWDKAKTEMEIFVKCNSENENASSESYFDQDKKTPFLTYVP